MALPRMMPSVGIISSPMRPQRVDYLSPEQGGRLGGVTAGFPLWRLEVNLRTMTFDDADEWEAWLLRLRGPQNRFYGFDPTRAVPRFHAGGRPYRAHPATWSQAIDSEGAANLTLTGLLAGQVVSRMDYIGFEWDTYKRSLVRAVETKAAGATGSLVVAVEPPVPTLTPSSAAVNLRQPTALMRLITAETKLSDPDLAYVPAGGKVVGIQDLVE